MNAFLDFVMLNYTWLLIASIIILLAIIGYYADKTNFGQGKEKNDLEDGDKPKIDLDVPMGELLNNTQDSKETELPKKSENIQEESEATKTSTIDLAETDDSIDEKVSFAEETKNDFESNYEKYDKELDTLLPEKDFDLNGVNDLLSDIDDLSLDRTQRINLSDIPNLDDVDLPRIKQLTKEDEDIWKF